MKKVLGKEELEAYPPGARVPVPPATIVTPLARDYAEERGLILVEGAFEADEPGGSDVPMGTADEEAVVAAVADEVVRTMMAERVGERAGHRGATAAATAVPGLPGGVGDLVGHRGVVTATGRNAPGILAELATEISRQEVDIVDLSQTIVAGFFTMILVVDTRPLVARGVTFADFRDRLVTVAKERGFEAMVVHERVLQSMQRL